MKKKTLLLVIAILVFLMVIGAAYARTAREPVAEKKGFARGIFDSIACLFKCGWPAWVLLVLPPIAVWFYTRFIHVF